MDNTVQFSRWGGEATVSLPAVSIRELRRVCHELLPKSPPETSKHTGRWDSTYDESTGMVNAQMSPVVAKQLSELLLAGSVNAKAENAALAEFAATDLEAGYQAHLDYIDTDEPGVDR